MFGGLKCELISYSCCNVTLIEPEYVEPFIFQNIPFQPLKCKWLSFLIALHHRFILQSAVFCRSPFFGSGERPSVWICPPPPPPRLGCVSTRLCFSSRVILSSVMNFIFTFKSSNSTQPKPVKPVSQFAGYRFKLLPEMKLQ